MIKKSLAIVATFLVLCGISGVARSPVARAQVDPFSDSCAGASAQSSNFCKNVATEKSTNRITGPTGIITKVTQVVVYFSGAFAFVMVVIGGLRYVISAGDSNGVSGAKNTILYALVGVIVAMFAQVMVSFVLSRL